ncbi:MAG: M23 family metallopeptidase [Bacteroidetes bacterium]|nr:MAG: M23 family metallopeptidase [Bacteroidota bacterium]
MRLKKVLYILLALLLIPLSLGIYSYSLPKTFFIPVQDADEKDWNAKSFWYYPWGNSVTHKGVDIFAKKGKPVLAATSGMVIKKGEGGNGGKFVVVLGPNMVLHYYAHLDSYTVSSGDRVKAGEQIGTVGNTGNAQGKAPHLHYSMVDILPRFSRADTAIQGKRKMWYRNPIPYLKYEKSF